MISIPLKINAFPLKNNTLVLVFVGSLQDKNCIMTKMLQQPVPARHEQF